MTSSVTTTPEADEALAGRDMSGLLCCPHCGSDLGYFRLTRLRGKGEWSYTFDGSAPYNGEFYDSFEYVEQKKAFCLECRKEIRELKAT